jgi:hypothetical protein
MRGRHGRGSEAGTYRDRPITRERSWAIMLAVGIAIVVFSPEGDASPRSAADANGATPPSLDVPAARPVVHTLPPGCGPSGAKFQCNPLTNAGCDRTKGEACDDDDRGGFGCYPGPNTGKEGGKCDDKVGCTAGLGCDTDDDDDEGVCARFCCTNADCGAKKCTIRDTAFGSLGFCT